MSSEVVNFDHFIRISSESWPQPASILLQSYTNTEKCYSNHEKKFCSVSHSNFMIFFLDKTFKVDEIIPNLIFIICTAISASSSMGKETILSLVWETLLVKVN